MPENEKRGESRPEATTEEYRCLAATVAAVTIPAATVATPVATAWAKQHFNQEPKDTPRATTQQPKTD